MESIVAALSVLPPKWAVFLISMLPVVELRGAIPAGMALGLSAWEAFLPAVAGSALVTVLLLCLLPKLSVLLRHLPRLAIGGEKFCDRLRRNYCLPRTGRIVGLLLFVAVPLPGTGVWTGCLLAYLLGMERKNALPAVLLGMVLAACFMTLGSLGLFSIAPNGKTALFWAALLLAVLWFWEKRRMAKKRQRCSCAETDYSGTDKKGTRKNRNKKNAMKSK